MKAVTLSQLREFAGIDASEMARKIGITEAEYLWYEDNKESMNATLAVSVYDELYSAYHSLFLSAMAR